jgi:hypothetical protein
MQIKCCPSTISIFQQVLQKFFSKRAVDIMLDVISDEADQIGFLNVESKCILCRSIATWVSHFANALASLSIMPTRKTFGLPEPDGRRMVPALYFLSHDKVYLYSLNHNKANFTPGLRKLQNLAARMAHLDLDPGPGADLSNRPNGNKIELNSPPEQNQAQQQPASPAPSSIQARPLRNSRTLRRLAIHGHPIPHSTNYAAMIAGLNDTIRTVQENTRALGNTLSNLRGWEHIVIADVFERRQSREDGHVEAGGRGEDVEPRNMNRDSDNVTLVEDEEPETTPQVPPRMRRRDRMRLWYGDFRRRVREATRDVVEDAVEASGRGGLVPM